MWRSHVELLQSFSRAAELASSSHQETPVGGHSSAVLVAGNQPLNLNLPTVLPIPPDIEAELAKLEQAVAAPQEEKSVDSFYSLTDETEAVPMKEGPSPIPEENSLQLPVSPR